MVQSPAPAENIARRDHQHIAHTLQVPKKNGGHPLGWPPQIFDSASLVEDAETDMIEPAYQSYQRPDSSDRTGSPARNRTLAGGFWLVRLSILK